MPQQIIALLMTVIILLIQRYEIGLSFYPTTPTRSEETYFKVGFPDKNVTIIIKLVDPTRIAEARNMLKAGLSTKSVMGKIIKTATPYNAPWHYQLDPASISFFELATEVCDAAPDWVEENLSAVCSAALPNCVWCPWSSQLLSEVQVKLNYLPLIAKQAKGK